MNLNLKDRISDAKFQKYGEVVLEEDWWWAVQICLSVIALLGNFLFIITIIYNRKRHDLKTFVTAVMTTVAVLDIIDVGRILPVLHEKVFEHSIFRNVYCSLGVFHELTVAVFLVSMAVVVCIQAGKEQKYYGGGNNPTASLAQKIFIPLALVVGAGISVPLAIPRLLSYPQLDHHCVDPFLVKNFWSENAPETGSEQFHTDLYATVVTAFTYIIPVLVIPLALPIAALRTCISRQCCVPRYKQPIGELVMTTMVCIIYLGTVVGVVLPKLDDQILGTDTIKLGKAPLLWELANNAARPLCYFMTNPGVWDGLNTLFGCCCGCCCKKKHQLVSNDDMEEAELPLAPVTTV